MSAISGAVSGIFRYADGITSSWMSRSGRMEILSSEQESDGQLFALDRATCKVRWKLPRAENHSIYATPCIYTPPGGKPKVVVVSWRTPWNWEWKPD